MDPATLPGWLSLLMGPAGTLTFALIALYALVSGGQIVPGSTYKEAASRAQKAEDESDGYVEMLRQKEAAITDLKVSNARLEAELEGARRDIKRLEAKTDRQTEILGDIRDEVSEEERP